MAVKERRFWADLNGFCWQKAGLELWAFDEILPETIEWSENQGISGLDWEPATICHHDFGCRGCQRASATNFVTNA